MENNEIKLWHCPNARSLRPLWALEEMGLKYQLEVLPFPPRFLQREFLSVNPLGTVPYFTDGETRMTESTGICHYLVQQYDKHQFALPVEHPEYGDFLNWLYHSDATLTFPQTIFLRYTQLEPEDRKQPQVAEDYAKWYLARLRLLDEHLLQDKSDLAKEFLCGEQFTIADIAITYALYLGELQGLSKAYAPQTNDYLQRMKARPAFQRAVAKTADAHVQQPF